MADGYTDTPVLPGTEWHVHDPNRPQPTVVVPGSITTAPAMTPPSDAIVLFDGSARKAAQWVHAKDGRPLEWKVEAGWMEVVPKTGDIQTVQTFGDIQLHVEWAAPFEIETNDKGEPRKGQGRGNSGVFLHGLYEIQVLDNWQNPTYADGQAGAIYGEVPPLVNACARRGDWNVYDILWTAPRFEGEKLVSPAYVTVLLNGVCVQNHTQLIGPTGHRDIYDYKSHGKGPVKLQDHSNPMRFRNIWVREL